MKVYEKIHHGSFVDIREVTLSSDDYDTFFEEVVKTCSYAKYSKYTNASVQQAHNDLVTTGRGSHGWIDWTITKD